MYVTNQDTIISNDDTDECQLLVFRRKNWNCKKCHPGSFVKKLLTLPPTKKNLSPIFVKNSEIIAFCLKSSEPFEFCMSLFGTEMWQFFDFSFFYSVRVFVMNNVCHFYYSTKVRIILISLTFSRYKRFYFHLLTVRLTVY